MKIYFYHILLIVAINLSHTLAQNPIIANHTIAKLNITPVEWIDSAKANLHIALTCPQKRDPIIKLGSKEKKLWAKTNSQQSRS